MNHSRESVEASYRFCRRMSRRAGSNFYAGFLLLPGEKRRAMEALYAFMRHTDDLADTTNGNCGVGVRCGAGVPPASIRAGETPAPQVDRRKALAAWRAALHGAEYPCEEQAILPALADTVARFHVPLEHLLAVIDGVEMDLDGRRYETFDELLPYCERVASAVGLACIRVWGFRGPQAFEPARQAGIALQLTNILRDLGEDARAGRVYLPLADLRECGYSVDDLTAGVDDARFRRLMKMELARAEEFYRGAEKLVEWLAPDGQRIFGLMLATYRTLLQEIARDPSAVLRRHVRLGRLQKARLFVRWAIVGGVGWVKQTKTHGGASVAEIGQVTPETVVSEWIGLRSPTTNPRDFEPPYNSPRRLAIIGGGLSGIAAAANAIERGFQVELFEQATSLGGRAGSFVDSTTGDRIDYCQHVAMGCCAEFLDFCRRTNIDDCWQRESVLHFIGPDNRQHDFAPSRWLPAPLHLLPGLLRLSYLSWRERWSIIRTMRRLATMPREKTDGVPLLGTSSAWRNATVGHCSYRAVAHSGETIGQWLRQQNQSQQAIDRFWSMVLVSALGETVDHASLAAARQVFRDGFLTSREASEVLLPLRPLGELFHDRLMPWLAERGVSVHLETPVRSIEIEDMRAKAMVTADGQRRELDAVIVAVPWREVRGLLPVPWLQNIERIESAAITSVHLWFDRRIAPTAHAALVGRLGQWVFAKSDARGRSYCQVVISASHRVKLPGHDALIGEIRHELDEIWPAARTANLLHARVVAWPFALFSPLPETDGFRPPAKTPLANLALAGDWTATGWPATMESAVRSGNRAVAALHASAEF